MKNVRRNEDGRIIVKLPFKSKTDHVDLGDTRKCAIATQFQLEKRFKKDPKLGDEYSKFIREGIDLGHIVEVPFDERRFAYYIPQHCVFKDSTTTKLRVVYNASQKTTNGKSLTNT